jgi:hypothetical protein
VSAEKASGQKLRQNKSEDRLSGVIISGKQGGNGISSDDENDNSISDDDNISINGDNVNVNNMNGIGDDNGSDGGDSNIDMGDLDLGDLDDDLDLLAILGDDDGELVSNGAGSGGSGGSRNGRADTESFEEVGPSDAELEAQIAAELASVTVSVSVPRHVCPLHVPQYTVRTFPFTPAVSAVTLRQPLGGSAGTTASLLGSAGTTASLLCPALICNDLNTTSSVNHPIGLPFGYNSYCLRAIFYLIYR